MSRTKFILIYVEKIVNKPILKHKNMEIPQDTNNAGKPLGGLTGRWRGEFYLGGTPRGSSTSTVEIVLTRYEPDPIDIDTVFANLGITDDGYRTPFGELHPAVKPVKFTKIRTTDWRGQIIDETEYPNEA